MSIISKRIYLDYASLTPISRRVMRVMRKFSASKYANPSSWYKEGVWAREALQDARKKVAKALSGSPNAVRPNEIFFTSGGTEANNIAIVGAINDLLSKGVPYEDMHIIISAIEHSSVRECANFLSTRGIKVSVLGVGEDGVVLVNELSKLIQNNTVIVSVIAVNNETGIIQPIKEIAKIIRKAREHDGKFDFQDFKYPIFHSDASQALYTELFLEKMGVSALTLDGSKMYGPRGVGALYIKEGTPIAPVVFGGGQEKGLRSGTENLPAVAGFAQALCDMIDGREAESKRLFELRNYFIDGLKEVVGRVYSGRVSSSIEFLGNFREGLKEGRKEGLEEGRGEGQKEGVFVSPHILNVLISGLDGEFFVMQLDAKGVAVSTRSSCLHDEDKSYVLEAMKKNSRNAVRFSFGRYTTKRQLGRALKLCEKCLSESGDEMRR